VEAYEPRTMRVLGLTDREGAEVELGVWRAEASPGNLYEHLEPEQRLDAKIGEPLRLMGYTLSTNQAHRGDEFSLLLFWRGAGNGNTSRVIVQMQSAVEDVLLADTNIAIPAEGRGLCSLFDVRVPTNFPVGVATLSVNGFKIGEIKIAP